MIFKPLSTNGNCGCFTAPEGGWEDAPLAADAQPVVGDAVRFFFTTHKAFAKESPVELAKLVAALEAVSQNADYLADAPPVNSLEDLAGHKMVGLDAAGTDLRSPIAFPSANPLPGQYVYLTNSPAAQLSAVRCGFGIGVMSHRWAWMVGDLVRVLPDYTPQLLDLWLVTHEELRFSARIRALYDFIAERVLQDKSLFETGREDGQ